MACGCVRATVILICQHTGMQLRRYPAIDPTDVLKTTHRAIGCLVPSPFQVQQLVFLQGGELKKCSMGPKSPVPWRGKGRMSE